VDAAIPEGFGTSAIRFARVASPIMTGTIGCDPSFIVNPAPEIF
jgi:hypothetical protein